MDLVETSPHPLPRMAAPVLRMDRECSWAANHASLVVKFFCNLQGIFVHHIISSAQKLVVCRGMNIILNFKE